MIKFNCKRYNGLTYDDCYWLPNMKNIPVGFWSGFWSYNLLLPLILKEGRRLIYIDTHKILSYGSFLNFIVTSRGFGKTFGFLDFCASNFIKSNHENQFIYLRRFKTETAKASPTLFDKIKLQDKYKKHNLYTKGSKAYIDDEVAGFIIPLSQAQTFKSVNFSKVKYIIFDEFILEPGHNHYIENEVELLLGFIETVMRNRDDVRVFCLGNAVTQVNPYFMYFNLSLPYNNSYKTFKDGLILMYYGVNEEFLKQKQKSKIGRLTAGTQYSAYAISNEFRLEDDNFIEKKTGSSQCHFAFKYKDKTYGAWFDFNAGKIFVSFDYDPSVLMFSTTHSDHTPNTMMISEAKEYHCWKTFIKNYKMGNVYFESQKIKVMAQELMKLLITR